MRESLPPMVSMLMRCARLRCPVCGESRIFQAPFRVRHHCPTCGALFEREEGFFVGAIVINVLTTEIAVLMVYFVCLLTINYTERLILTTLLPVALIFPVLFYHHSWSIWLCFDHVVERLPKYISKDQGLRKR